MACQRLIGGRVVVLHIVMHRPDERYLVHHLCQLWQMFADCDAICFSRNWLMNSAERFRRTGLHVEHVDVAGTAELVKKDDRLGTGSGARRLAFRLKQLRHGSSEQSE